MNEIVKYNEFEATLKEVEINANFLPDVSTAEGYEKSKRIALDGRKVWNAIDKTRKELGIDARKMVERINTEGKEYLSRIDSAINPHLEAYKEHDEKIKREKEEFEQRLTDRIDAFCVPMNAHTMSSEELRTLVDEYKSDELEGFYNRTIEAGEKRNKVVDQLIEIRASKIIQEEQAKLFEAQQLELEAQREAQAKAQAVIDEANRIEAEKLEAEQERLRNERMQAEEQERIKNAQEAAVIAERERAESEKLEAFKAQKDAEGRAALAEEAAKQAVENARLAEVRRQEEEKRLENEAREKREANKHHIGSIRKQAKESFMNLGIDEEKAKELVLAIHNNEIKNITISY